MTDPEPIAMLTLAREDECAAKALLSADGVADSILGFHCQQAVEKALKATLGAHGVEVPYTHDLDGLLEECRANGLEVPDSLLGVEALTIYAVQMRYDVNAGGSLDRDQAVRWAADAVHWAAEHIAVAEQNDA